MVKIPDSDIQVERVSGKVKAGGQSSNRNYSAIRLTHLPTGIQSYSQETRSQAQNLALARAVLQERVDLVYNEARTRKLKELFPPITETIRTYNFPDNYVKDKRSGERYNLKETLDGKLDSIIEDVKGSKNAQ